MSIAILAAPAGARRFHSDDLDEVRQFTGETLNGSHTRVLQARGAYGFACAAWDAAGVRQATARSALPAVIRGTLPMSTVQLNVDCGAGYANGRLLTEVGAGTAVFLPQGTDCSIHHPPGTRFGLSVPGDLLQREVASRAASGGLLALRPRVLRVDRAWWAAVRSCLTPVPANPGDARKSSTPPVPARLLELLADALLPLPPVRHSGGVAARRLAALEEWIEAHLHEPLTLGRLCEQADVGARALQLAFAARRGMSPMRFVTERRLEAAYRRLLDAAPDLSVTQVASDLGFTHLGRFTADYRRLLGELPSQTLRKPAPTRRARSVDVVAPGGLACEACT